MLSQVGTTFCNLRGLVIAGVRESRPAWKKNVPRCNALRHMGGGWGAGGGGGVQHLSTKHSHDTLRQIITHEPK